MQPLQICVTCWLYWSILHPHAFGVWWLASSEGGDSCGAPSACFFFHVITDSFSSICRRVLGSPTPRLWLSTSSREQHSMWVSSLHSSLPPPSLYHSPFLLPLLLFPLPSLPLRFPSVLPFSFPLSLSPCPSPSPSLTLFPAIPSLLSCLSPPHLLFLSYTSISYRAILHITHCLWCSYLIHVWGSWYLRLWICCLYRMLQLVIANRFFAAMVTSFGLNLLWDNMARPSAVVNILFVDNDRENQDTW